MTIENEWTTEKGRGSNNLASNTVPLLDRAAPPAESGGGAGGPGAAGGMAGAMGAAGRLGRGMGSGGPGGMAGAWATPAAWAAAA